MSKAFWIIAGVACLLVALYVVVALDGTSNVGAWEEERGALLERVAQTEAREATAQEASRQDSAVAARLRVEGDSLRLGLRAARANTRERIVERTLREIQYVRYGTRYDSLDFNGTATVTDCNLALGSCREYAAALAAERDGYREQVGALDRLSVVQEAEASFLRSSRDSLASALASCQSSRDALRDAVVSYVPPRRPSVFVGPAVSREGFGVAASVPLSVPLPLVGRVALSASGVLAPGCAAIGIGVGL